MKYIIKPIGSDLRDYAVINTHTYEVVCRCYIKKNAELIADILNTDDNVYAYKIVKTGKEEFEDLKDFVSDIIGIYNNATGYGYYPEDLEIDFDEVMEKWSKKIEHYKWGKKADKEE